MVDGDGQGITVPFIPELGDISKFIAQVKKEVDDLAEYIANAVGRALDAQDLTDQVKDSIDRSKGRETQPSSGGWRSTIADANEKIMPVVQKASSTLESGIKSVIGILQDVHKRLLSASPLLQSVERLFNLAVTLFFMPLGNKLATVMLPAVLELVDGVMEIWDKFDGKSFSEMLNVAVTEGAKLFGEYFISLGEEFKEQGGILGSIGSLLVTLGNLIEKLGDGLLERLLDVFNWLVSNLGTFIGTLVALKFVEISLQAATAIATNTIAGMLTLGISALAAVGAGASVANMFNTSSSSDTPGYAEGGYIPPTPGGKLIRVAEGGEGEYIVPESKALSGGNTYNITINGMTNDELKNYITEVVNDRVNESRLRSVF